MHGIIMEVQQMNWIELRNETADATSYKIKINLLKYDIPFFAFGMPLSQER